MAITEMHRRERTEYGPFYFFTLIAASEPRTFDLLVLVGTSAVIEEIVGCRNEGKTSEPGSLFL